MILIYKVVNKCNDKIYIGQTVNTIPIRRTQHFHEAKYSRTEYVFHKALKKYGEENFKWEVVCKCRNNKVSDFLEEFFINRFNSFYGNGKGYNMTNGGRGFTGRHHSKETKKILKEKNSGRTQTQETKEKISEGLKKVYKSGERINAMGMLGKKQSKKTRKKMSSSAIGNTNGSKIWNAIYDGENIEIKNLTMWCKENSYPFQKAQWRIKHDIDLKEGELKGRPKTWNVICDGKETSIKNLSKWCRENNYSEPNARYRIIHGIDLMEEGIIGRPKTWNFKYKGKEISIKNLNEWCSRNNYYMQKAKYKIEKGMSL